MRSLKVLAFLLSIQSVAISATTSLSFEQGSQTAINEQNIPFLNQVLSLSELDLRGFLYLNINYTQIDQSAAERNLTLANGEEVPLQNFDDGIRQVLEVSFVKQIQNHSLTISFGDDVKKSVFSERKLSFADRIDFYSGATALTFSVGSTEQNQPVSFFTQPETLQSTQRSSHLSSLTYSINIEQIWTENYKTDFAIFNKNTKGYRPTQISYILKQAYALGERWSYLNELGLAEENRSERLSEDRGYFRSLWFDQEINYEWKLDSFVGLGWSTLDENENDPRRSYSRKLGSDQLGAYIKQQIKEWAYEVRSQYTLTSNNESAVNFKGAISWDF